MAGDLGRRVYTRERSVEVRSSPDGRTTHTREAARELCHDLRGPAATIMAIAAAAAVEGDVSSVTRAGLVQIADEARRISHLCREVLEVGGRESLVSVDELAESVVLATSLTADATIRLEVSPALVYGNPLALGRVLSNLLDNAVQAAGKDGEVLVEVSEEQRSVRVAVSDSGDGFQASHASVGGLGLRIAGRIVAEHGGELAASAVGPLGGASVVICLPAPHLRTAGAVPS